MHWTGQQLGLVQGVAERALVSSKQARQARGVAPAAAHVAAVVCFKFVNERERAA